MQLNHGKGRPDAPVDVARGSFGRMGRRSVGGGFAHPAAPKPAAATSLTWLVIALAAAALLAAEPALAKSSLGIGTAEVTMQPSGPLAGLFLEINRYQRSFFTALRTALVGMKNGQGGAALLVGLSFLYGIFHAAGPGHGKAVISSYVLANEVQLRRGIALSFVSALLQAATAILAVGAGWFLLRGTAYSMTDATDVLEVVSYALIAAFGGYLTMRKIGRIVLRSRSRRPASPGLGSFRPGLGVAMAGSGPEADELRDATTASSMSPSFTHDGMPNGSSSKLTALKWLSPKARALEEPAAASALRADAPIRSGMMRAASGIMRPASPGLAPVICRDEDDCGCGQSHMPDPAKLGTSRLSLGSAASAVFAVGLRPCSGTIVVLTFALLNGLYVGGLLSVVAMAIGTAVTVSAIAAVAVLAKDWALRFSRAGGGRQTVLDLVELAGALLVLVFGLMLLAGSLA